LIDGGSSQQKSKVTSISASKEIKNIGYRGDEGEAP